jgi:hypothetical protein
MRRARAYQHLGNSERAEQHVNEVKKIDPGIETRFTN